MNKLFILTNDGGDGSYYPSYVIDEEVIKALQKAYDDGVMTYENGVGVDGDGFHYDTLVFPNDVNLAAVLKTSGDSPLDLDYVKGLYE